MKKILAFAMFSVLIACNNQGVQKPSAQYEEKKSSLEGMERDSPLKFLRIKGSYHGNLLNQMVISGELTNKATVVGYKSIKIQVTYKDDEGAVIEKEKEVLDNEIKPNSSEGFKFKTGHVKGVSSIDLDIQDATPL